MDVVREAGREPAAPAVEAPAATQRSSVAAWASAAGNHAIATTIARSATTGAHGSPGTPDSDFDPATATDAQRVAEIRRRLGEGGSVREVWRSFADVPAAANANPELWKASVARDPGLAKDEAVLGRFRAQVEALALQHLAANRDEVAEEMDQLGVTDEEQGKRDPEHLGKVAELQALADEVNRALQLKLVLLQIPVGFDEEPEGSFDATDPQGRRGESRPKLFEPGKPPTTPPSGQPGFQPYEAVAKQYKEVEIALARGMAHPALFALVQQAGGPASKDAHAALRGFATDAPGVAQANITGTLHTLLRGIERTAAQVGGSIDYRDLRPVHDLVLKTPAFAGAYERSVAETEIAGHDQMATLLAFGLAAVQAIALLSAPVLGPAALIPIVGIGAGQAAVSYADYQKLKAAREARTGRADSAVVDQETVDAAELQAILDGVFAFVDGIEGFAAVAKAAKAGARTGAAAARATTEDLPRLATLDAARKDAVLGEAMATMGPGPAIDAAGGIETVRTAAAGTPALVRANGFVDGLEDGLAQHLAGTARDPASPLLDQAATYVAGRAQVPKERGLRSLLPWLNTDEEVAKRVTRRAAQAAPEWAGKSVAERHGILEAAIKAESETLRVPPPGVVMDPSLGAKGRMSSTRWAVHLPADVLHRDLSGAELTDLLAVVRHEVRHAHQMIQSGRYACFHAGDKGYIAIHPKHVQDEILARGPLPPGEVAEARGWYGEWGPGGLAKSNAVRDHLVAVHAGLAPRRAAADAAHRRWGACNAAMSAAATHEERLAAGDALIAAHQERIATAQALDARLREWKTAYDEYFELPTEADARLAEQAFNVEVHERWSREAREEVNRNMAINASLGAIVALGGMTIGGYVLYEVKRDRAPAPAR